MGLSYTDAVKLMGGRDSRVVAALDRLAGGLLLAGAAASWGLALSLFDAEAELARLSNDLVRGLSERLNGLDRFGRSERLAAAHSVLVLAAYFEVVAASDLPLSRGKLKLSKAEQVSLAGGGSEKARLGALATGLLRSGVPMPAPQLPYEKATAAVRRYYEGLSAVLTTFVSGLAVWDQLDEAQRRRFAAVLSDEIPDRAMARYEELFRDLAAEFPEFAFWANLVDHQATREEVRQLSAGMGRLEQMFSDVAAHRVPDDRRQGLSRAYRAALRRPVLTTGDVPEGLVLPLLGDAYVSPDFRVAASGEARFAEESWWDDQDVRHDLEGFLFGHLTAPQAVQAPLLILGQPGSGKSVLTQILAARLPPGDFLVVRVVLREVAADADLQTQIEHAIRSATGETLSWPDLARSANGALPIVLIDGFDELLQATGVSQTDYLRRIADFQARENDQGRPVAVLVTSRTAVADRAQPVPGMVVAKLEPFRKAQISQWLGEWNEINTPGLIVRGLRALPVETLLEHADLASQPLLLLMLALYDADGNRLQRPGMALNESELYERLLVSFAGREVSKSAAALPDDEFQDAVEKELLRLSVVAFAMFSRGRQWVSEAELDADLAGLLGPTGIQAAPGGLRAPLSAAEVVVGRFFFVHEAQATRDDALLRTYEFLHATFGEYLIARLISRELGDLADAARLAAGRARAQPIDDAFPHALLSYMPVTMRSTIMSFLADLLAAQPMPRRQQLGDVVVALFHDALYPRHDTRYRDYEPLRLPVPARHAAYSANLAILSVLTIGAVTSGQLFPKPRRDSADDWRYIALLWRSQLPGEGWVGLVREFTVNRIWEDSQREIILSRRDPAGAEDWSTERLDPLWTFRRQPGFEYEPKEPGDYFIFTHFDDPWMAQTWFGCDDGDDMLAHALEPLSVELGAAITAFHAYWPNPRHAVSAAHALIALWLASGKDSTQDELVSAYDTCLNIVINSFAPHHVQARALFRTLVLRQLAADQQRMPDDWLNSTVRRIRDAAGSVNKEGPELLRIAEEALPRLMITDHTEQIQAKDSPS